MNPRLSIYTIALLAMPLTASALNLAIQINTPGPIVSGQTGIVVTIAADEDLVLGSTDITFGWNGNGIQVDTASSWVLGMFTVNINNAIRTVRTASATGRSDIIPAGMPLMTFLLTANKPGAYTLYITDGDGVAPDDLAGPVPPIPPLSILYYAVDAELVVEKSTPGGRGRPGRRSRGR